MKSTIRSRKLNRKKGYDYSQNGYYFVTICTKNRVHWFGEIVNGQMQLNNIGLIANKILNEISNHFPHIFIDESVIMPNHIHGILAIDHGDVNVPVVGGGGRISGFRRRRKPKI
jgi:putative transposase